MSSLSASKAYCGRACLLAVVLGGTAAAQSDWPSYGHDSGGTHYSPLTQIDTRNVARLRRAWTFHTGENLRTFETTPIVAGSRMYLSTQSGNVVALEPETGRLIWKYDAAVRRPREHRGVAYWPGDRRTPARILFGTSDGRLIALDAATGTPAADFGTGGQVDLRAGASGKFPNAAYAVSSPPAIYRDLVIVGPSTPEGPSRGPSGDPRAFDVRTGKLVWRFHSMPQPGEPGSDSWGPGGTTDRSGPSAWGLIHVDTARGLVFIGTGNPADSFYGADRKGTNLYANCVVALDAATGKLRWYYQVIHHDIFDYDLPGGPALIEVNRQGRRIPAVAQITKSGLLFILDRLTGKPVFGVEERPVPPSDVPGEQAWPTQPFPVKPPPLARTTITREELTRRTPEAQRFCTDLFDKYRAGSVYTPYGGQSTVVFPGYMGGGNWGGVSFDPRLGLIFVNTSNVGGIGHIVKSREGAAMPYYNESGYARFVDHERYPCQQPPWGELSAVNANTGDVAWRVPLGNYDELASLGMQNTGTPNVGGTIVTAGGLVFVAGTNDSRMRAFDSRTGKELWSGRLDAAANATPITYLGRDGNQYVVVAAGGSVHFRNVAGTDNLADTVIAFSLNGTEPVTETLATKPAAPSAAPKPAPAVLPDAPEKADVVRICGSCHGVATFAAQRMTRAEWRRQVDDMISRGARGTPEEMDRVVDYLATHLARQ